MQESPCDDRLPMSGGFCNRAGTALVLVETLRKVAEAALRDAADEPCAPVRQIKDLLHPCRPRVSLPASLTAHWHEGWLG